MLFYLLFWYLVICVSWCFFFSLSYLSKKPKRVSMFFFSFLSSFSKHFQSHSTLGNFSRRVKSKEFVFICNLLFAGMQFKLFRNNVFLSSSFVLLFPLLFQVLYIYFSYIYPLFLNPLIYFFYYKLFTFTQLNSTFCVHSCSKIPSSAVYHQLFHIPGIHPRFLIIPDIEVENPAVDMWI